MISALVLALFLLPPRPAGYLAATLVGRPDLGPRLEQVCERESSCTFASVHPGDSLWSGIVYAEAVRAGKIGSGEMCPLRFSFVRRPWSTRGAWGTMAGYTVGYLSPCAPPWALDVPLMGALAAARRMASRACLSSPRCRSWAGF